MIELYEVEMVWEKVGRIWRIILDYFENL